MLKKIKNFCRSKKTLLLLAILPVLGFLFFPRPAHAAWYSFLISAVTYIPMVTIALLLMLSGLLTMLSVSLCSYILQWITGPSFTSLSYTNPAGNEIIRVGLGITQGFVNIILVLVLVFIAIVTILRLENYKTKILLRNFIIVALLVNFAPVICGLIVDASNIVMNFFLSKISAGQQLTNNLSVLTKNLLSFEWIKFKLDDSNQFQKVVLPLLVLNVVNILTGLILLIFAFVFLLRYIMIWFLVILSPIAFASYILPSTKNLIFDKWKNQFIQWSTIGITCGFFLYLSDLFVTVTADPKIFDKTTGIGSSVLPSLIPLVFLGAALVLGLSTNAAGASVITSFGKKQIDKVGAKARGFAWGKTKELAASLREKVGSTRLGAGARYLAEKMTTAPRWGEGQTGLKGLLKRTANVPWYYARRTTGLGLQKTIGAEADKGRIEMGQSSIKETDSEADILSRYHRAITKAEKIGILNKSIDFGKHKNMMDIEKFGNSAVGKEDIKSLMPMAKNLNLDKKLKAAFPDIAAEFINDVDAKKIEDSDEFKEAKKANPALDAKVWSIINKSKAIDMKNWTEDTLKDVRVVDALLSTAMGSHINQLTENMGKKAVLILEERVKFMANQNNMTPDAYLEKINPRLYKWKNSSGGRGLIDFSTPLNQEAITKLKVRYETEGLARIAENAKKTKELDKKINQVPSGRNLDTNQRPYGRKQL